MENVITQHITKAPGVCGGRACIAFGVKTLSACYCSWNY